MDIFMKLDDLLLEVKVLGNETVDDQKPLMNSDTIRLYHGFSDPLLLIDILQKGISGDRRIVRRYSYENNNNPKGLFSTPSLKTAKEFGDYVIEFHTRVSDLESPVWPSGTFTGQGQMSEYWEDEKHRDRGYQALRKYHSESTIEAIYKSDKPEVAASLFLSGEPQALFRGNLNPNSIRAVWMKEKIGYYGTMQRYNPRDIIKMANAGELPTRYGTNDPKEKFDTRIGRTRVKPFMPREEATLEKVIEKYMKEHTNIGRQELLKILSTSPHYMQNILQNDTQYHSVIRDLEKLGYNMSKWKVSPVGYN